ncbi:hypothetical protein [Aureimonas mangrovi]|uniref:hypothetical protein n=1 Tax=Aureimonas mangrovi TaxID=2758041 RepID=UPI00163D82A8|nr:hypothetical protein [Aureimonas mangrovi]
MAKLDDMPRGFGIDPAVFARPQKPAASEPLRQGQQPETRQVDRAERLRAARRHRDRLIAGIEHGFEVEGEIAQEPRPRPSIMLISLTVGLVIAGATLALEWF